MKFDNTFMIVVEKDLKTGKIPMLLGEPGIGKSSWVEALATKMHTKAFTLACNQLADKADLTGARLVPVLDKDGNTVSYKQMFYPHAVIYDAVEYANENQRETPILFLDELNRTTPDITSALLSIPTARSIGNIKLPSNLKILIAGNDKGNIVSLDEASITRFVLYRVGPDVPTFLAVNPNLNIFVKNVLQAHPELIFCKQTSIAKVQNTKDDGDDDDMFIEDILDDGEEMKQITTPRTITAISDFLNEFTSAELLALLTETKNINGQDISVLQEVIEGHIGETYFSALLLAEITTGVLKTNNQVNAIAQPPKPAIYDTMKACQDMTALTDLISTMSENDKGGCLVYALYEKVDNAVYITALCAQISSLISADMKNLMQYSASEQLDTENVKVLLGTKTPLAQTLSVVLDI